MSIDKINEFKSSILDEVYRHQGFLTSVSNVVDSYDNEKKAQLTEIISEQQRLINKSLGLVYAFFRTVNSFDEKENQIKQIVGNDLDNAFLEFESSNVVDNNSIVQDVAISDVSVVDNQSEQDSSSTSVVENAASNLFETTDMVVTDDNVVPSVEVANTPTVSEEVVPQPVAVVSEGESVSVEAPQEVPVVNNEISSDATVAVTDVNIVAPDTPAPENSAVTAFVLSPIEEGVSLEQNANVVADVPVESNASVDVAAPIVSPEQAVPAQDVVTDVPVAPISDASVVAESTEVAPVVDSAVVSSNNSSKTSYVRKTAQAPKAILVTVSQMSKLSTSKDSQVALINGEVSQAVSDASGVVSVDPQAQVQELMNKASEAYALGKAEEAQLYMNQVSELNKQIQGEQSEGGVTLVKK